MDRSKANVIVSQYPYASSPLSASATVTDTSRGGLVRGRVKVGEGSV